MENRYNLIDEKCISSNEGMVSIMDCFTNNSIYDIGNTTQKLCILKLLFAIGQASNDFDSLQDIADAGIETVRENIVSYLKKNHDKFYLYGDRPFLQFPRLANFDADKYFVEYPINKMDENFFSDLNGVYVDSQIKENYSDSDKANLLIVNLGSPLKTKLFMGNKEHVYLTKDKNYVKSPKLEKNSNKPVSTVNSSYGFFNGGIGMLHGFVTGRNIMQTVFVNILPNDVIEELEGGHGIIKKGVPPWEIDDMNETHEYKKTYYSYLVPMNRFMLFNESETICRCTEGIFYHEIENNEIKTSFMLTQPDVFIYQMKKKNESKNDNEIYVKVPVVPMQSESVIYSLRPFIESNKGSKEGIYNKMIRYSQKLLTEIYGEEKKEWKEYGIEFIGTEYELSKYGMSSFKGYSDKRFGYGTIIGRDEKRMNDIVTFVGDRNNRKTAYGIINTIIYNIKRFYLAFLKANKIDDIHFNEDEFFQKCRCLVREAESRSVNGEFNLNDELKAFSEKVKKMALQEIGMGNSNDRGRKIELAYKVGLI